MELLSSGFLVTYLVIKGTVGGILIFFPINFFNQGRPVAQLVERAPHIQRLCPRAADLGSISPVALCCMSFPLSLPCFLSTLQLSCK